MLSWLLGAGVGPAAVALPVNWTAATLANAAQRWFRRLRRADDLSRLVRAATGTSVDLTHEEFDRVRRLLEDQQTWTLLGKGTVEDLTTRIADCLPPRGGRTGEESHAAAMTIARGLLEFAVADLDPKLFQQLLLTRLQRMETDHATALDRALLDLHADLVPRFATVMEQFRRVLDRLPPGRAQRSEIVVYLTTLTEWLNTDPWPQDRRLGGPVLTPAVIERKLRITVKGLEGNKDLDADELAQQCRRLVILGGPGSGKTWLAKRTARRCADEARKAMAAGATIDDVEIPLYTTCSSMFSAEGDIRNAVVASALDQLADLGGSRVSSALRVFFTERNSPTLLVIDSLDEAHGPDERLRQADTLPWRIILTSRPSSWNHQLIIEKKDDSWVGELKPLRYPDDIEPFIERWFEARPQWGKHLAKQIAQRPDLQQAATVPLLLAFYCIVGSDEPLPQFRRDLYTKVLNRLLTGRWRGRDDHHPDIDACLRALRAWAWSGAANDPVSGLGTWVDDIPTNPTRLGEAADYALDHVATPLGPPDLDLRKTLRRFIHRSIREHLVAEHVANLPVDLAAKALFPHLWHDPDWEYSASAALAAHPQRDHLLRSLIDRTADLEQISGEFSVIGTRGEFSELFIRLAAESSEGDWSPEVAGLIGQARVRFGQLGRASSLRKTARWRASNREARDALLEYVCDSRNWMGLLFSQFFGDDVRFVSSMVLLAPTAEDQRQVRSAILGRLASHDGLTPTMELVDAVVHLAPTAEDQRQVRDALRGLLDRQANRGAAAELAVGVAQLSPTAEDRRQARIRLLRLLAGKYSPDLARLVRGVVQLAPAAPDQRRAREALLVGLASESDGRVAAEKAAGVAQLTPTAEDRRQGREALLRLLADQTSGRGAEPLVGEIVRLAPTAGEQRQVRDVLLGMLASQADGEVAAKLAAGVAQLGPTGEEQRQARETLLRLLASGADAMTAQSLVPAAAQLGPTAEDQRQLREVLLRALTSVPRSEMSVHALVQLSSTAEDRRQAREALLALLASRTDPRLAERVVAGVVQLAPTAEDRRQARESVLALLASQPDSWTADHLVTALAELGPTLRDLTALHTRGFRVPVGLLAAVRRNSALADWLVALPSLTSPSSSPA